VIGEESFDFVIETQPIKIPRWKIALESEEAVV
jgi:hypothetical protein